MPEVAATFQMWVVMALVLATIVSFVLEKISLEVTSLIVIAVLLLFFSVFPVAGPETGNLLDPRKLLEGFANPGLITVLALLVVGQALVRTGALSGMAARLHTVSKGHPLRALVLSLLPVTGLSSIVNNTPVVVIFIPILSGLAEKLRQSASRFMMPLSFAAILGGMTTLIGSSTNLLVASSAVELGLPAIGFFDFLVPGLVLASVGLVYVLLVMPHLLPDRTAMAGKLSGDGRQFIAQVEVLEGSSMVGEKPVAGLFRSLPDMTVRMVQRDEHAFLPPLSDITLEVGDIIVVAATRRALTEAVKRDPRALHPSLTQRQFTEAAEAADLDSPEKVEDSGDRAPWHDGDQVLAEVMVTPTSRFLGLDLEDIGFRHQFHCIVLGLQRRSRMIRSRVTNIRLAAGDVLLIQGAPADVRRLRESADMLLIQWSQESLPVWERALPAIAIFGVVVVVAATGLVPIVVAALLGATAMILFDCINLRQAARAIDRQVVMVVGASLALGAALQATGAAQFLAHFMLSGLSWAGPAVVVSALFLLIALVTNLLSNNASAVLFTPIAVNAAHQLGIDPTIMLYTVIFGANCSFASPIGYQTNMLVMAPGHYRFIDYVRAGIPLLLLLWVTYSFFAAWTYDLSFLSS